MKLGIDPTVDVVFKKLFGSEKNKPLLLSLINAVMQEADEELVEEVEILNPYNPQNFLEEKLSIVDIKAKNTKGKWFIIEMQIQMHSYFPKRLLYYWAKTYQQQLSKGEKYNSLSKVTVIAFSKADLPIETENYYNHFKVLEVKDYISFADDLSIHTIELEKFVNTEGEAKKQIEKWSYFLKHGENLDDETLPPNLSTPEIKNAVKELIVFTKDEKEREIYESRKKAQLDHVSSLSERYDTGLQKGKKLGEQVGLQKGEQKNKQKVVLSALKMGLELSAISELTDLSISDIEEIRKKHSKDSIS